MLINSFKVIKSYKKYLIEKLKEELTLPNPKYASAVAHSKFEVKYIPKNLYYYWNCPNGDLIIPTGVKTKSFTLEDKRTNRKRTVYPPFRINLRELQKEAIKNYMASLDDKENSKGIIVVPTGSGKSILGLALASELKAKVLVIVHKKDLVDGWTKDAEVLYGLNKDEVGVIQSAKFRIGEQITIATIQTLSKKSKEQLDTIMSEFDMLILDEAHHAPASSYEITMSFNARHKIALTATDQRNDGLRKVMDFYFGDVCYRFDDSEENDTIITPSNVEIIVRDIPNVFMRKHIIVRKNDALPLDCIIMQDCIIKDISNINKKDSLLDIVYESDNPKEYKVVESKFPNIRKYSDNCLDFLDILTNDIKSEYLQGKSNIVLVYTLDQCEKVFSLLCEKGVPKEKMQLFNSKNKNIDEIKNLAETKEVLITIATQNIATEGTNVKTWENLFLANSIANEKDLTQAIGRVRRLCEGKEKVKIFDYRFSNMMILQHHGAKRDLYYAKSKFNHRQKFIGKSIYDNILSSQTRKG